MHLIKSKQNVGIHDQRVKLNLRSERLKIGDEQRGSEHKWRTRRRLGLGFSFELGGNHNQGFNNKFMAQTDREIHVMDAVDYAYIFSLALDFYLLFSLSISICCMYECTGLFKTGRVDSLITMADIARVVSLYDVVLLGLVSVHGPQFVHSFGLGLGWADKLKGLAQN